MVRAVNRQSGSVLILALASIVIMGACIYSYTYSVKARHSIAKGLNAKRQQLIDSQVVACIAVESAYTAINSGNVSDFATDVEARFDQIDQASFTTVTALGSVPSNLFWPLSPDPVNPLNTGAQYSGKYANLMIFSAGRSSDLGTQRVTFQKGTNFFDVDLSFHGIPLSNYNVIAYGLPTFRDIAENGYQSPGMAALATYVTNLGGDVMIATQGDPANDTSAVDQLYTNTGTPTLSYFNREEAAIAWAGPEYIWRDHQVNLVNQAGVNSYDFGSGASSVPGVTAVPSGANTTVTINLDAIAATTNSIVITDYVGSGVNTVRIQGAGNGVYPLSIAVRNYTSPLVPTRVIVDQDNSRPVALYAIGCSVETFPGQLSGLLALGVTSSLSGSNVTINGSLFYEANSSLLDLTNVRVNPSSSIEMALEMVVPRVTVITYQSSVR